MVRPQAYEGTRKRTSDMYYLFKDDPWGNKIPFMAATKPFADRLLQDGKSAVTRVVNVPRDAQSLISVSYGKG